MKRVVGWALLLLPFAVVFGFIWSTAGLKMAAAQLAGAAMLGMVVIAGVKLAFE